MCLVFIMNCFDQFGIKVNIISLCKLLCKQRPFFANYILHKLHFKTADSYFSYREAGVSIQTSGCVDRKRQTFFSLLSLHPLALNGFLTSGVLRRITLFFFFTLSSFLHRTLWPLLPFISSLPAAAAALFPLIRSRVITPAS